MRVLVTGAAGALGSAVVRALAKRGDSVMLLDRAEAHVRSQALAKEVGHGATSHVSLDDIAAGEVDGAALVAGGWAGGKPLHETTDDTVYRAMMESNVDTVYFALRALLPGMVARKSGSIVVVGSRNAERPWTGKTAAVYTASKAAAVALAQAAAAEVLEHGVRVNAVLPSTLDTPANRASMPKADFGRWVATASAAEVIAFLLSDGARDISGAAIPLYGRA